MDSELEPALFPALNAWTFPPELSVHDLLAAAANARAGGLELATSADGQLAYDAPQQTLREIASHAENLNLQLTGLVSADCWRFNFTSAERAERERAEELLLRLLDQAATLGAGSVLVIPAVVGRCDEAAPRTAYADALHASAEALRRLRHEAEARRVALAIENVWNRFLLSPVEMAGLIDRVNSPYVGAYFDVGNVMPFGYPQDWIDTLGGRIARVHVKDYDLSRPGRDGFCPLGQGSVDWAAAFEALQNAGYDGPLTYEGPGDPAEAVRRIERIIAGQPPFERSDRT